ncbi:MAG: hypothetical protein H9855_01560 [Candidatus Acinetobacter avistercoris]|uniref:hypothetical protein n=1 Tax=Acinetobacter sp. KS-LM10 TaxID=3120518 RepID=UPI001F9B7015|nr:hypothetical protein [Candidatus Acinetobacter avistercoris]
MKNINIVLITLLMTFTAFNASAHDNTKRPDTTKLCQGKAINTRVSQKIGDRTLEGTCQIGFKANQSNGLDRGLMRDPAIQNACKGKVKNTAVVAKVDGKNIPGKCDIVFRSAMKR